MFLPANSITLSPTPDNHNNLLRLYNHAKLYRMPCTANYYVLHAIISSVTDVHMQSFNLLSNLKEYDFFFTPGIFFTHFFSIDLHIFLHSGYFLTRNFNEIFILDVLSKPKACITHFTPILTVTGTLSPGNFHPCVPPRFFPPERFPL